MKRHEGLGWPKKNLGWPSGKVWVAQWKTLGGPVEMLGGPRVEMGEVGLFATKEGKKAGTPLAREARQSP